MKKRTIHCGAYFALATAIGCSSGGGTTPASQAGPETAAEPPAAQAPAESVAAPAASFSLEQADRGRSVFDGACSSCHSVGEFRGTSFSYSWRRRTAWHLFLQMVDTMPEDAPGSLSDQEYVDVVSYMLQLNGHDAGAGELSATEESLGQIPVDPSETGLDGPDGPSGSGV